MNLINEIFIECIQDEVYFTNKKNIPFLTKLKPYSLKYIIKRPKQQHLIRQQNK